MFVIRKDQFDSMGQARQNAANQALADYARARFPDHFRDWNNDAILAEAARLREAAREYGFVQEDQVGTYWDLSVMYGPGFPMEPWASPFVNNIALTAEGRMEMLRRHVKASGVPL